MAKRNTRRVLVVIDRAILDVASVPEVVLQAEARADQVRVIAPVLTSRASWLTNDDLTARQEATDRLTSVLHRMWVEQGISASGELGDESPLTAIADALVEFPADQLIVIMHDDDQHNWHERDLAANIRRRYASRLTEVIVAGSGVAGASVGGGRLSAAEQRFQRLLEFAPDAMVGVDGSGGIVVVNRQAELLFGYSRGELIGQPSERLVPERFRRDHRRYRAVYTRDRRSRPMAAGVSMFGLRKDGSEFAAEISLSSVDTGAGTLAMAAIRDITGRLRAEAVAEEQVHRRAIVAAILEAEAAERARIATALHDDTVQVMIASLVMLGRVAEAVKRYRDADVQALIERARSVVEEATERTRRLTFELRPAVLHELGLSPALTAIVEQAGQEIGAEVSVAAPSGRFDWQVEELVYRTVQEAVANIRRHSQAHRITVSVERLSDRLAVVVADDGRGFDVAAATDPSSHVLHMGLHAMIERVRMAGGSIRVDSSPSAGSRISFQLPLADAP